MRLLAGATPPHHTNANVVAPEDAHQADKHTTAGITGMAMMRKIVLLPVSCREFGKRTEWSINAASDYVLATRRLFLRGRDSLNMYLTDTGADVSVFPRSNVPKQTQRYTYELVAANGTAISTYGRITLRPNVLCLRRKFVWRFLIADVDKPIIGAYFLSHIDIIVNFENQRLIDAETNLFTKGVLNKCGTPSVKTVVGTSLYHGLLADFIQITRPLCNTRNVPPKTVHHILTTPGPPTAQRIGQTSGNEQGERHVAEQHGSTVHG